MSDTAKPPIILMPDQRRVMPSNLVPLWTWLAVLTVSVSIYFLGCSQGWPMLPSFGMSANANADEIRGQVAALFGVPAVSILGIVLMALTEIWMRRGHELQPPPTRWDALPAPDLWGLPSSDGVTRVARALIWVLVLGIPVYTVAHLFKIYPRADIYQQCEKDKSHALVGCTSYPKQTKPGEPAEANPLIARAITADGSWFGKLGNHLSVRSPEQQLYVSQQDYFRHGFRYGDAHGPSYYPGFQAWVYMILVVGVLLNWCRLMTAFVRLRPPGRLSTAALIFKLRKRWERVKAPTEESDP